MQHSPLEEMDGVAVPETPHDAARVPETDMIRTLASLLDEKLKPLTASNELMQQRIDQVERAGNERMMELKENLDQCKGGVSSEIKKSEDRMRQELKSVQEAFANLKIQSQNASATPSINYDAAVDDAECTRPLTALFQNLDGNVHGEEAKQWLRTEFVAKKCPNEEEIYYKGDNFNGLLFARFASQADRDQVVRKFRFNKLSHNGKEVRCKQDLPVDKRFVYSVLFGFRYLVCKDWSRYNNNVVKVDMNSNTVKIRGQEVMTITFDGTAPDIVYEAGWKDWLQCPQWEEMVQSAHDKWESASSRY